MKQEDTKNYLQMHRLTKKPWFGPKKYVGWGWRVTSWQGALILAVFVGLIVVDLFYSRRPAIGLLGIFCIIIALIIVALLTGDPPGGGDVL